MHNLRVVSDHRMDDSGLAPRAPGDRSQLMVCMGGLGLRDRRPPPLQICLTVWQWAQWRRELVCVPEGRPKRVLAVDDGTAASLGAASKGQWPRFGEVTVQVRRGEHRP